MNTKTKLLLVLVAAVALPLSWANATATGSFTHGPTIFAAPGDTITLNLQLAFSGTETSTAVDYFLKETAGPSLSQFTIASAAFPNRNYTGSDYPDPSATNAAIAGQNLNATANGK